jgi:uncharacterized membrane protein YcaP (DUF421 family)
MDWQELGMTAARGLLVYVLMLVVIRLLGKRTVGNFTAFDLLVALMLGEVVDEIIYGDVTIAQGVTAILVVALAKYATAWLAYLNHGLNHLFEGKPRELVRNGQVLRDGMRKELINEEELMAAMRLQSVSDLREVKRAVMEVDGEITVIREDWAEPLQKRDVFTEDALQVSGDEIRTDSPKALGTYS